MSIYGRRGKMDPGERCFEAEKYGMDLEANKAAVAFSKPTYFDPSIRKVWMRAGHARQRNFYIF